MTASHYVLARRPGMQLDDFATRCALHPDMVRRLVALGLVACQRDARGDLRFEPSALVTVGRIQRLRTGLGLNYAAIGLVLDLLDHIEELESILAEGGHRGGHQQADAEVTGGVGRSAEHRDPDGSYRGRW